MRLRRHRSGKLSEAGAAEDVPVRVAPLVALLLRHEHAGVSAGVRERARSSEHRVDTRGTSRGSSAGVRSNTADHVSS